MVQLVLKSFKDLLDKKIFFTSLKPIIIAAVFSGVLFFLFIQPLSHLMAHLTSYIPFIGKSSWMQNSIHKLGSLVVYYDMIVISSVVIVGIIADKIVDIINGFLYRCILHLPVRLVLAGFSNPLYHPVMT